jgi:hypothetical protein
VFEAKGYGMDQNKIVALGEWAFAAMRMPHAWCCLGYALVSAGVCAAETSQLGGLGPSEDGSVVIDSKTQQAWARCDEGMLWSGKTCKGEPAMLTHAQATAWVAERKRVDGLNWRLPRVKDLQRLAAQASHSGGWDPQLFPAAPLEWHWAQTANVNTGGSGNQYNYGNIMQGQSFGADHMAFLHGWAVNLGTGEARGDVTKRTKLPVRLVRSLAK